MVRSHYREVSDVSSYPMIEFEEILREKQARDKKGIFGKEYCWMG